MITLGGSGSARAIPVQFDFDTSIIEINGTISGVSVGTPVHITVFADNGGSSLINQTWNSADITYAVLRAGTYTANYFPPTGSTDRDPVFTTGTSGEVTSSKEVFFGSPIHWDSLRGSEWPEQSRNAFITCEDVAAFWGLGLPSRDDSWDPQNWTVTVVPTPSAIEELAFEGTTRGNATAVSADGSVVVGGSENQAFRWTVAGGMEGLGLLPSASSSNATSVSADGSVVVGSNRYGGTFAQAFRWTVADGMQGLGFLPGDSPSSAAGISADGSVVIGTSGNQAFRWTVAGGMEGLGLLPGASSSSATGVSADGSVVIGSSGDQAFRWTSTDGMEGLGLLPGASSSNAAGVSADGNVVVGTSGDQAFRWTVDGGMQGLGLLPSASSSIATDISADGHVIVGTSFVPFGCSSLPGGEVFRWTKETGMVGLGQLTDENCSQALNSPIAVSADGSVIVGESEHGRTGGGIVYDAFVWDETNGMRFVIDAVADAGGGLDANDWPYLESVRDVSADGTTVIGNRGFYDPDPGVPGGGTHAYRADISPTPATIRIEKLTNGIQADDANDSDVPRLFPGTMATWTYEVTNIGVDPFAEAEILVTDSQPGITPVLDVTSDDGDLILSPGETWIYQATAQVINLETPPAGVTVVPGCGDGRNTYENVGRVEILGTDVGDVFQQDYRVIMEVESYIRSGDDSTATHRWQTDNRNVTGTPSGDIMAALTIATQADTTAQWSTIATALTDASYLEFDINFLVTGPHYLWVRHSARGGGSNSIHVALDGVTWDENFGLNPNTRTLAWDGGSLFNVATTGVQALRIMPRDQGSSIDKIVITKNQSYAPATLGTGPVESSRGSLVFDEDYSHYCNVTSVPTVDIDIEKLTNGSQADGANNSDVPRVASGDILTWTYQVTNTGEVDLSIDEIAVSDSQSTVAPALDTSTDANNDMMLSVGEIWTYTATATALDLATPPAEVTVLPGCADGRNTYQNTGRVDVIGTGIFDEDLSHYCNPSAVDNEIAKEDVIIDFGGIGLWDYMNDSNWLELNGGSPERTVAGDLDGSDKDDVISDFGSAGIWVRRNLGAWTNLNGETSEQLAVGDLDGNGRDDLIVDFGAAGLWAYMNDTNWPRLNSGSPEQIVTADIDGNGEDDVVGDFGPDGVWIKRNQGGWMKLHPIGPEMMAVGDLDDNDKDDVLIDFGVDGLWAYMNDTSWLKLLNNSPDLITTGDLDGNGADDILAGFELSGDGLWQKLNLGTWSKLNIAAPDQIVTGDVDGSGKDDIIATFASVTAGLFIKRNQTPWARLHFGTPESLAVGNLDGQ